MNKLQSAIEYAQKGFYVIPTDGKRPLIKFANTPPLTVEQVKYYWSKYPDANIALRTVDFFVVDIDAKQAHGVDGIKSLHNLPKGAIIPTLSQRTASGGYQLFYQKPHDSDVKQIIGFRAGIDIKAHINNYAIVPPSNTNKGVYQWINPKAPIKSPSKRLLELLKTYNPPRNSFHFVSQARNNSIGKKWTGIVLDNLVQGAPEGQRNDYLTRLCGQMIYAGADSETVWTLINYANQFNTPPLEDREVGKIVASVLKEELSK